MENRAIKELLSAVQHKIVEQEIQLRLILTMERSAKETAREFKKKHRKIQRGSSFFKYYEAKLAFDDKESKNLQKLAEDLSTHVKKTKKMLSMNKGPYFKEFKAYKRAEKIALRKDATLRKFQDKLLQKESLNSITPEERLKQQIETMKEKEKELTEIMLIAKAQNTNEKGACQELTNSFVAKLETAFQECLSLEKCFYEQVANIESTTTFYKRVQEIDKMARDMDVLQTSNKYFNDVLKIETVIKDAVFDTETINNVREEQRQQAELKREKRDIKPEKDISAQSSQQLQGDSDEEQISLASSRQVVL